MKEQARAWLELALWACLLLAPGGAAAGAAARSDLVAVPLPSLSGMDAQVSEQLREARDELDQLLAAATTPLARLAEAFGGLGQIYLAYDLVAPAEACLRNARTLAPTVFPWSYLLAALYQNEGRLDEAATSYGAALELAPDDLPTLVRAGNVELERGEVDRATALFERALALAPTSAAAYAGLGRVAATRGDHAAAIEHFEAALAAQPAASSFYYPLALAYRELGRRDEARQLLARHGQVPVSFDDPLAQGLIQLATGAGVHLMFGNRALRQGNVATAIERYRQALAADPRSAAAHQALAAALAQSGRAQEAVDHYSAALALEPDNAPLHYNLGTLLVEHGQAAQGMRHFQAALALEDGYLNARFNLAVALAAAGRHGEAVEHYRRLLESAPEDRSTRFNLAQALLELGRAGEAAELLVDLVAEDPSRAGARLALARAHLAGDEADASRQQLQAVLALADAPPADRALAHVLLADLEERAAGAATSATALASYRTAIELEPSLVAAHLGLARQLARHRRYDAAADAYHRAIELAPRRARARFGEAMALLLAGRDGDARQRLEEGTAALPEAVDLQHLLARLLATSQEASLRDGERALRLARSLFAARPSVDHAETLAMALAELGRFREAADWQRRLVAEAEGHEGHRVDLVRRLQLYEQAKPCRSPWAAESSF